MVINNAVMKARPSQPANFGWLHQPGAARGGARARAGGDLPLSLAPTAAHQSESDPEPKKAAARETPVSP